MARFVLRKKTKRDFLADESGATMIEYGLIVALVFLAIVASVNRFADSNTAMYERISATLTEQTGSQPAP